MKGLSVVAVRFSILAAFLVAAFPISAITVGQLCIGATASEQGCAITRQAISFAPSERQIFFWFVAQHVKAGDELKVEWLDPDGKVAASGELQFPPHGPAVCPLAQFTTSGV